MKIRLVLPILVLAVETAGAATFNLPKNAPLFSIEMPNSWITEEKGDVIVSRPAKDSKVSISVTVIPGAKNLEEAFTSIEKAVGADYQEFSVSKPSQEKEAGMDFLSAAGKGKSDGVDFRIALAAFSPDGQRFFGISWGCDEASGETYGNDIDLVMNSIKSFKEEARKEKDAHDKATATVPFPKDKPAFTMEIPNGFTIDATAERLVIKTRKERKTFFHVAAIPAGDEIIDEATAKAWMPKKAQSLLDALGEKEAKSRGGVEEYFRGEIAGQKAFETVYHGDAVNELKMWVFTPDGKRFFYAYFQEKTADFEDGFKDAEADISRFWPDDLLNSIELAK